MAVDYYKDKSQDHISLDELDLYHRIMAYRRENGLPDVALSKGLTITAGRHALDTVENVGEYAGHSWSDAPYDSGDASTYPNMWKAPERLGTSYQGDGIAFNGFEITAGWVDVTDNPYSPAQALSAWQGSPPHNDVILNKNTWSDNVWKAIGLGMLDGIAHVWFGNSADPGGVPTIQGSKGADTIKATKFADKVLGLGGKDKISGAGGSDTLDGGDKDDTIDGGAGDDKLLGGNGKDVLKGGSGNDRLDGGASADVIEGGKGADRQIGGKGADIFEIAKLGDSTVKTGGRDRIDDFSQAQGDRVDLSKIDASTLKGGNQKFAFRGEKAFGNSPGQLRFEQKDGDTYVYGDVNGDKAADFSILFKGEIDFVKGDFVL